MPNEMHEVDRLLEEIRRRVRHADILRRRGGGERELAQVRSELGRLRGRLADLVSAGHSE
ncbi:MAG TPA: hypothetical protein VFL41_06005 [Gaiellaceae bacterium]|nr:hypothetical protein [Gaiellaceae bacterium]